MSWTVEANINQVIWSSPVTDSSKDIRSTPFLTWNLILNNESGPIKEFNKYMAFF